MNWKLIFGLSLFGLAMSIGTVYWIQANVEPFLWLAISIGCAIIIAQKAKGKYFLHGFMVSIFNCVWMTGAHIILSAQYLSNHPKEAETYAKLNHDYHFSVAEAMLIMGPFIAIISGLFFGLFAFVASRIIAKTNV